jgi:hypothetical protein
VTGRRSNQLNYDPKDKLKSYTSFEHKKIGAVNFNRPDWVSIYTEGSLLNAVFAFQLWPIIVTGR